MEEVLKEIKADLKHHIRRTEILEGQVKWMQWVLPVCTTILGIVIALS